MEALFTRHADSIDGFVAACRPIDRQVGALFLVAGRVVGFDLFDRCETLRKMLPKLVRTIWTTWRRRSRLLTGDRWEFDGKLPATYFRGE